VAEAVARRAAEGRPVLGICGGFQMLGERIEDEVESRAGTVEGLGLLPVRVRFAAHKTLARPVGEALGERVEGYERGLGSRQVQMIAIGGAIGVGLFMKAGANIAKAGPSIILMYALAGVVIFFIMRALGELLLYRPVTGSFSEYAREFLGPFFGYVTGWTYWLLWVVTGMAELTAAAIY
ncbi:amino acid permease, partial [Streptomyces sparsogenes]|uniref:amino acid permease n=1 Tax=Streptomyces sparsogenes TaxID=67365 RepID=UPI001B8061B5